MTFGYGFLAIIGLAAITVITRGFFLIPKREVPIPAWLREALRHAPLAALVAAIAPDLALTDGHLLDTWRDARLYAAMAGALWYWRTRNLLGMILVGTAVLLGLRLSLGW